MTDVRSQRLNAYTTVGGALIRVWTTPAGMVTLFKGFVVFNSTQAAVQCRIYLGTLTLNMPVLNQSLAANQTVAGQPWIALNPSDWIGVSADVAGIHYFLSGAVLQGPPPVTPPQPVVFAEAELRPA